MGEAFKSNRLINQFLVNIVITMIEEIEEVREVVIEEEIEVEIEAEIEVEIEEEIEAEDHLHVDRTIVHPLKDQIILTSVSIAGAKAIGIIDFQFSYSVNLGQTNAGKEIGQINVTDVGTEAICGAIVKQSKTTKLF